MERSTVPRTASLRDDRGAALPFAMLVAILLAMLASLLIANALMENRASFQSEQHESTLHVAESGAEVGIERVLSSTDPDALMWEQPLAEDPSDLDALKSWAVAEATRSDMSLPDCDDFDAEAPEHCMFRTATGEATFLRPQGSDGQPMPFVLGVGFTPSRDDAQRVRVVMLEFGSSSGVWSVDHAFIANGDLEFDGGPTLHGGAHSNAAMTLPNLTGTASDLQGPLTWSGEGGSEGQCSGHDSDWECGHIGPKIELPPVTARTIYDHHVSEGFVEGWLDLCANGAVRLPLTDPDSEPCEGKPAEPTPAALGWSHGPQGWRLDDLEQASGRTYYVHGQDVDIAGQGDAGPGTLSIIVERVDGTGGNLEVTGNPDITAHHPQVLFWVDGDIELAGDFEADASSPAIVGAGGTIKESGGFGSENVAYYAYHRHGDSGGSSLGGSVSIKYDATLELDFAPVTTVQRGRWTEL